MISPSRNENSNRASFVTRFFTGFNASKISSQLRLIDPLPPRKEKVEYARFKFSLEEMIIEGYNID